MSERICAVFWVGRSVILVVWQVEFASSGLLYLRGATWSLLLKLNWDSEHPNFYGSVSWFLIPKSDLTRGNVFGPKGVCVPLTSANSEGLTDLYHLGKRISKWFQSGTSRGLLVLHRGVGEGKKQKGAGREISWHWLLRWLCYVLTTGLGIWTFLPPGSKFTVFMM